MSLECACAATGEVLDVIRGIEPAHKADGTFKEQAMPSLSLEERVAVLEQELSELKARRPVGREKDWRRTIGVFTDHPQMKELFAEAMKLREADRRKVRGRQRSKSAAKS
jgi:hypothetical protein